MRACGLSGARNFTGLSWWPNVLGNGSQVPGAASDSYDFKDRGAEECESSETSAHTAKIDLAPGLR